MKEVKKVVCCGRHIPIQQKICFMWCHPGLQNSRHSRLWLCEKETGSFVNSINERRQSGCQVDYLFAEQPDRKSKRIKATTILII